MEGFCIFHLVELDQKSPFEFVLPTVFVSSLVITQNSHLIQVALSVIANYLTSIFKIRPLLRKPEVNLSIVYEKKATDTYEKLDFSFKGAGEFADSISRIIEKIRN